MQTLLQKLQQAVNTGAITSSFSTADLKAWIKNNSITDDHKNGANYTDSYIEGFLSSSLIRTTSTKYDLGLYRNIIRPYKYHF